MDAVKASDIDLDEIIKQSEVMADFVKKKQMETLETFIKTKLLEVETVFEATDPALPRAIEKTKSQISEARRLIDQDTELIDEMEEKLLVSKTLTEK